MKIKEEDEKEGIVEIVPETLDDLWHLSHIIEVGDNASSLTTRRIQDTSGDKLRCDRGVKRTFNLGLDIENITFQLFTGKLRLTGVITKGPDDLVPLGSHHTLEVKLNTPITIKKDRWQKWAINRLNLAIEASKKLSAIIVVLEDDTATLGLMRQYGIEYYGPIKGHVSGKRIVDKNRQKNIIQFYEKVIESIEKFDSIQNIVIAGPGFVKNDFYDYLTDKHSDLAKISIIEATGSGGRNGIAEVLKKGTVEKLTSENRVAIEMGAVDNLLTEIANSEEAPCGEDPFREELHRRICNMKKLVSRLKNALAAVGIVEYVPKPGDRYDYDYHRCEDAEEGDHISAVKQNGMILKRKDEGDIVLLPADVEVDNGCN
jgi:protein pelota